jgi:LCP family protein required for cell wall assembly
MARRHRKKSVGRIQAVLAACCFALVILLAALAAHLLEDRLNPAVENAGQQVTAHTQRETTAQVFINDQWYGQKEVDTLLVMGVDTLGALTSSGSYNNTNQVDFLALFIWDPETKESHAIHLNRDTMTDITVLGVTGQSVGTRRAQLALAYNYGSGDHVSSANVVTAVERLLYGMEVDHYITLTMDAVPVLNDWAGGVTVNVLDDFAGIDDTLVKGRRVRLEGQHALTYVRTRFGLDDSSNLHRMERQRQYASAWVQAAKPRLNDPQAIAELVTGMGDFYRTDCTAEELEAFAGSLSQAANTPVQELPGQAIRGEDYMEFHVDEAALQQQILDLFYIPLGK